MFLHQLFPYIGYKSKSLAKSTEAFCVDQLAIGNLQKIVLYIFIGYLGAAHPLYQ